MQTFHIYILIVLLFESWKKTCVRLPTRFPDTAMILMATEVGHPRARLSVVALLFANFSPSLAKAKLE